MYHGAPLGTPLNAPKFRSNGLSSHIAPPRKPAGSDLVWDGWAEANTEFSDDDEQDVSTPIIDSADRPDDFMRQFVRRLCYARAGTRARIHKAWRHALAYGVHFKSRLRFCRALHGILMGSCVLHAKPRLGRAGPDLADDARTLPRPRLRTRLYGCLHTCRHTCPYPCIHACLRT